MSQRPAFYHPMEVRTYGLKELAVPPARYDRFLLEAVHVFKDLVIEENKCESLEEVAEKYLKAMKKINPGKSEEDLFLGSPFALWMDATLKYDQGISHARKPNKPSRSTEYEEHLSMGNTSGASRMGKISKGIHLQTVKKDLAGLVRYLGEELDTRFPNRKGKMPDHFLRAHQRKGHHKNHKKSISLYDSIRGFKLGLHVRSEPTHYLEASITLVNFGAISGGKLEDTYSIPAIEIRASHMITGSLALPRKVVEVLGEVVARHYKTDQIEYKTSYLDR